MNESEKKRLDNAIKSLKSKNPAWEMKFGFESYTAKKLIKALKKDAEIRRMFFDMLDNMLIAEMQRDAEASGSK